jgi:hypothetical protein
MRDLVFAAAGGGCFAAAFGAAVGDVGVLEIE